MRDRIYIINPHLYGTSVFEFRYYFTLFNLLTNYVMLDREITPIVLYQTNLTALDGVGNGGHILKGW